MTTAASNLAEEFAVPQKQSRLAFEPHARKLAARR